MNRIGSAQTRPAAQYLRVSTEAQRCALDHQAAVISAWARANGFRVTDTYADAGKSGLTLGGRPGLKRLLADVVSPDRRFCAVLVLDVSRWGRFQDPDQAAHYEYICRSAGAPVVYCAEPFGAADDVSSTLLKQLKRAMAGEYSRELSERVTRAQLRLARLGFKQGGPRPYGVRRALVDPDGQVLAVLGDGERVGRPGDRVILVAGPEAEARVIRRIFRLFVTRGWTVQAIAERLNVEGVPANHGRPWSYDPVRSVLSSEIALGRYVFNRSASRLKTRPRPNPQHAWVRVRIMSRIVPPAVFDEAARRLAAGRGPLYSEGQMLARLRRLLEEVGRLNGVIIDRCPYTPASATYRQRFGSLRNAYERVGFRPSRRGRGGGAPIAPNEKPPAK